MIENTVISQQYLRDKYIEIKEKTGFENNMDVAKAYLDRYPIDTRHSAVWKEYAPVKPEKYKNVFRALGIRNNENDEPEYYDLGEFNNEDDARKAAKDSVDFGLSDDLLDKMILKFHKHQIFTGSNTKATTLQDVSPNITNPKKEIYIEKICNILDELEHINNLDSLISKGYSDAKEYYASGKNLRDQIIGEYISKLDEQGWDFNEEGNATYERPDGKIKRKNVKFERVIKSSTIDMSLCIAVIDFLAELVIVDDNAANILSKSHEWRIEKGLEKDELREPISKMDKIGANQNESLRDLIRNMIENQFDIQPLIFNGRCVGSLELKKLSKELAVFGYSRMGEKIDFDKLSSLNLISEPLTMIHASHGLHWFSRLLTDKLDALLFNWEPEEDLSHKKIHDEINPKLESGLHIITSHDILAYVEQREFQNN